MAIELLFPTLVYRASMRARGATLRARLQRECLQLRDDDGAGRAWSKENYPGGYTSYGSVARLYEVSPTFDALRRLLDPHVRRYARALDFDLAGRRLEMTDCWVNIMPGGVAHSWHLHPLSVLSGTYYVATPAGSAPLKLEDPRLDRYMAAPVRRASAPRARRPWVNVPAKANDVVLFESWLRHEVPMHRARAERISVSFNYALG